MRSTGTANPFGGCQSTTTSRICGGHINDPDYYMEVDSDDVIQSDEPWDNPDDFVGSVAYWGLQPRRHHRFYRTLFSKCSWVLKLG
jgi:hypothetical protein